MPFRLQHRFLYHKSARNNKFRVLKYSVFLKGCIVLTGGVLGLCAFVLIAIPDWKRDKKKKE